MSRLKTASAQAGFLIEWTSLGGATGNFLLIDLPFANASQTNNYTENHVGALSGITFTTGYTMLGLEIQPGTSICYGMQDGSGLAGLPLPISGVAATGGMVGTLIYRNA